MGFSAVWGEMSEAAARQLHMPDPPFYATGVSVVLHPRSPRVPIIHMNVRYFEAGNGEAWFGGGIDLTPIYVDEAQARRFHARLRAVCDRHNPAYYPKFTRWADDYFYLPHRQETRGVGGIFFDRLTVGPDGTAEELFAFVRDVAELFGPFYTELMAENHALPFGAAEEAWQTPAPRPLRRVQPGLRPGHPLRPRNRRPHRVHPDEPAAPHRLGLQPRPARAPARPRPTTLAWLRKGVDWVADA